MFATKCRTVQSPIEDVDAHTLHQNRYSKKKKQQFISESMEYSSSIKGTTEANEGRKNAPTSKNSQYGTTVSVMNSKAMSRMRNSDNTLEIGGFCNH